MKKILKSFPNKTTREEVMTKVLSNLFVVVLVPIFFTMFIDVVVERKLTTSLV